MTYKLKVTDSGKYKGAGRYHYQVVDETGKVISERRSNREYVACTINGMYYFGRRDLVGKGDHGKQLKWCAENGIDPNSNPCAAVAYTEQEFSMSNEAIEAFEAYRNVKVTWPDGRTRIINREQLEGFWEHPVLAKNLKNGYPFCKIETYNNTEL